MQLWQFVPKDLFSAIIRCLALEANAVTSADLVGLCREIFIYMRDRDPGPRQVPLSLLCINPQDLLAFEDALTKTASLNEEKQCMRSLLILGTRNKLNLQTFEAFIGIQDDKATAQELQEHHSAMEETKPDIIGLLIAELSNHQGKKEYCIATVIM
ncbi:protein HASTY 1 [Citrus clementina]|uniref:protein HASTY 1 n=1 Tax=Citrus clementina TaxID=85681 RepID=UPI000CED6746|nr:protein HASTY 1 [Citrus x clementina]